MSIKQISPTALENWVDGMIAEQTVYGPQANQDRFSFEEVKQAASLRLDYDVTILPPKKYFQPQRETLLKFNRKTVEFESVIHEEPFVVFGVHPYDVVALSQMDKVFTMGCFDKHYMARRAAATVVAMDVQKPSAEVFAGCMHNATLENREGFDVLLSMLPDGRYLVDPRTEKGDLLCEALADETEADAAALAQRQALWDENKERLQQHKLDVEPDALPALLERSRAHPVWEEKAEMCYSCGACNFVCPTCYCFNVEDEMNWDMETGERVRTWDGCMLAEFAAVAGGHNFRSKKAARYSHRYYRKGMYTYEMYGEIGCVGCGRCISACTVNIANPVEIFNTLAEAPGMITTAEVIAQEDIYLPKPATIVDVKRLTPWEKYFIFKLDDGEAVHYQPGQFMELSLPGVGECPISITSSPTRLSGGRLAMVIRNAGSVTHAMHQLRPGDRVGLRGPYGTSFPVDDKMKGRDLLFICGGLGLVPVKSAIDYVLDERYAYGNITILIGNRAPENRLFLPDVLDWKQREDISCMETVDVAEPSWGGNVGVITTLLPRVRIHSDQTICIICGPPIMYKFVLRAISTLDLKKENVLMSLERNMKCAVGKCGHCQINDVYGCQKGPVFTYEDILTMGEAI